MLRHTWACWLVLTLALTSATASAQRAGVGRSRLPTFNVALELLMRSDVRQELELLEDQMTQIRDLRDELRRSFRATIAALQPGEDPREALRESAVRLNDDLRKDLESILLPHQSRRLAQLTVQARLRAGPIAIFRNPEVAEQLAISDEQQGKLSAKAEEVEREYRRKLAELRTQTQEQMLSLLTPDQQARFRELLGEPFEFQASAGRISN